MSITTKYKTIEVGWIKIYVLFKVHNFYNIPALKSYMQSKLYTTVDLQLRNVKKKKSI